MTLAQLAALDGALSQPSGFTTYYEVQAWIVEHLQVPLSYHSTRSNVRDQEAVECFQQQLRARLHALQSLRIERPLEFWLCEESKFGLKPVRYRRLSRYGVKLLGPSHPCYHCFWLLGAVVLRTGDGYLEVRPALTTVQFQKFPDDLVAAHLHAMNVLLLNNAPIHVSPTMRLPGNVLLLFQSPHAPKLNSCERVRVTLKSRIAWRYYTDLGQLQD